MTNRCGILLFVAVLLGACGEDNGVDYCENHYRVHGDHQDSLARLTIKLSEAGDLHGKLSIPEGIYRQITDVEFTRILGDANNTFALQTEIPCEVTVESIAPTAEGREVNFEASCGPDNKIGQINVVLFDHLEAIEEIVVSVTTPATSKRFGIGRQCDGPIFRLD